MAAPLEPEEREWLLERSAELIAAAGWRRFVEAPLVLPDERSFPDRWTPDARGVARLARRLLAYAGLTQLEVAVEVFVGDRERALDGHGRPREAAHHGAAAWFAGIDDGVCLFGCEVGQLDDAIGVVGAMAHEVAHAFRRFHELEHDDPELEERLTDLTTIYLGFGVLTSNAALRHRSGLVDGNPFAGHQWRRDQLGYLPAEAMSFALALWWFCRDDGRASAKPITRALEVNQAGWFKSALTWLGRQPGDLRHDLGLPPRERWPAPLEVEAVDVAEPDDDERTDDGVDDEELDEPDGFVFRLRRHLPTDDPIKLAVGVMVMLSSWVQTVDTGELFWGILGSVGVVVVGLRGVRWHDECSDIDCGHRLEPGVERCPGCRRPIVGEIAERKDRLDAEERLLAQRRRD